MDKQSMSPETHHPHIHTIPYHTPARCLKPWGPLRQRPFGKEFRFTQISCLTTVHEERANLKSRGFRADREELKIQWIKHKFKNRSSGRWIKWNLKQPVPVLNHLGCMTRCMFLLLLLFFSESIASVCSCSCPLYWCSWISTYDCVLEKAHSAEEIRSSRICCWITAYPLFVWMLQLPEALWR